MSRSWSAPLSWAGIFTMATGLGIASAQGAAQPTADHDFVARAAMSNMVAIQLGHIATKKAQRADVKQFAQATIDDHLKAQQQLADAAYGAGVQWPTKLDDGSRQVQQRLSKLGNGQFDREYMKAMVELHRDAETMLAARISNGGSETASVRTRPPSDESTLATKVNQWATRTLPGVGTQLKQAEQVFGQLDQGE